MSADPLAGISAAATRPPLRVTGMASARAAAGAAPPLEPPPSLASLGLRADGDGGGGLVADRAFRAGAVVLPDDRPILVAPALRPSHPASKLLEPYFQKTHIPASVVLKLAAFLCAEPQAAERLAALPCPPLGQGGGGSDGSGDGGDDNGGSGGPSTATKPHPLAEQARAFAAKLSENPPPVLPAGTVAGWPPADAPEGGELEARWRALWRGEVGERRAGRAWVLWSLGARPTPGAAGSALGAGPAALAHVCRGANTMYVAPGEGGSGGGGGGGAGVEGGGEVATATEAPSTALPLPLVHVYTFMKHENEAGVLRRVERAMGRRLDGTALPPKEERKVGEEEKGEGQGDGDAAKDAAEDAATLGRAAVAGVSVHRVRDVAPKKVMLCVSFRLPPEVAFSGRLPADDPAEAGRVCADFLRAGSDEDARAAAERAALALAAEAAERAKREARTPKGTPQGPGAGAGAGEAAGAGAAAAAGSKKARTVPAE